VAVSTRRAEGGPPFVSVPRESIEEPARHVQRGHEHLACALDCAMLPEKLRREAAGLRALSGKTKHGPGYLGKSPRVIVNVAPKSKASLEH
jgi:hypothetical protein